MIVFAICIESLYFGLINKRPVLPWHRYEIGLCNNQLLKGALVLKLVCFTFSMSLVGHCLICMHSVGEIVESEYYFCNLDV